MQKACAWPRCTELAFLFDGSELSASHSRGEGRSFIVGGGVRKWGLRSAQAPPMYGDLGVPQEVFGICHSCLQTH